MSKLTGAALDRAVANAMGLKSVNNCEKWGEEHMTPDLYQFNCEVEGVELQCKLEYEPPEENYPDAPDIEECMNLVNATTNGVDIAHLLMQSIVDHICESALEDMKENSNDY
jgi:hypothetical protein